MPASSSVWTQLANGAIQRLQMIQHLIDRMGFRIGQIRRCAISVEAQLAGDFPAHVLSAARLNHPAGHARPTVAPAGTALMTTEFEPMRALSPTVNGPNTLAPAPITTFRPSVGWRLPLFQLVPPSVTP